MSQRTGWFKGLSGGVKVLIIGATGFWLLATFGIAAALAGSPPKATPTPIPEPPSGVTAKPVEPPQPPTCNGTSVTSNCVLDGAHYKTYVYHEAVPEKSHTEQVTNYEKKVVGYCTLCSDGTYSPSCATGRGACSHHGGVAQWNAPKYENVPVYTNKTVVDAPAQAAYYEKVTQ